MDSFSSSLQVPEPSPGPSRSTRPASVQPMATSPSSAASSRKRASHSVVTGHTQEEQPLYRDVYSHPAALEYAAAHPRRTIPKFGPYLLLRTLGEGEFGKVKLGLHIQWGEEVAVKLIRRGNIDTTVRMGKVEREIEVLRTLKHPNIVRLYDVIETDKYIGIILEYASGGELFDHILAHRYLREKDACKLFSQLISGVWYIHQKKIVHRDLKLENLLLDRHRNVIITDFGFANRFEHRPDDLMQTSCGSPCYAAPELVISDGSYVGSAVDIWSCGVILYAMLAGYLPFDDDPANPDGDNINLLYKYIVNTPLSFPDYISTDARDLLSIMLVPDPERRANLPAIMAHRWLAPYAHTFSRSVDELEEAAMEQHHQKRLAYQKQMRQQAAEPAPSKSARSQSTMVNGSQHTSRHHAAQPEYLYETSEQSMYSTSSPASNRRGYSAIVAPTSPSLVEDDPFAPTPIHEVPGIAIPATPDTDGTHDEPRARKTSRSSDRKAVPVVAPVKTSPDKRQKGAFRHTIQVEVGEPQEQRAEIQPRSQPIAEVVPKRSPSVRATESARPTKKAAPSVEQMASKPLPVTPPVTPGKTEEPVIQVISPPASPPAAEKSAHAGTVSSNGSTSSKQHKRGISMDKIGIAKIFGAGADTTAPTTNGSMSRTSSQKSSPGQGSSSDAPVATPSKRPSTLQPLSPSPANTTTDASLLSPDTGSSAKKNRRNTLTSIVADQFKISLKQRNKTKASPAESPARTPEKNSIIVENEKSAAVASAKPDVPAKENMPPKPSVPSKDFVAPTSPQFAAGRMEARAVPASTQKASRVMQWFSFKSKGKAPPPDVIASEPSHVAVAAAAVAPVNGAFMDKSSRVAAPGHASRSPSGTEGGEKGFAVGLWGRGGSSSASGKGTIRVHHGAVDPTMFTTGAPPEVMAHVKKVLEEMGVEIQIEGEYKYRCIRPKRRKAASGAGLGLRDNGSGLAALTMVGSAASNGVDKRGLPVPPQSHASFGSSTGGMLRGLLMRRQSSQVSTYVGGSDPEGVTEAALSAAVSSSDAHTLVPGEPIYGDVTDDAGDEVRFSVELTRLDRLDGTYSIDVRRLKGNLRSYKFLYETLRDRAKLTQ